MCTIDGCDKPIVARGWCKAHYSRWYKTGSPLGKNRQRRKCKVKDCDEWCHGSGYCQYHYWRWKKYGDPCASPITNITVRYSSTYRSYQSMKQRCLCPKAYGYHNYGGRGIKICERWLGKNGFNHFLNDMGERPEGYTLDRIDSNGDYCPKNCRWADWQTQGSNRRGLALITYKGKTQSLKAWSRELGLSYGMLVMRHSRYKWTGAKLFSPPKR